jgi:UDP-N-acetylglucosamine 4-epimerase
MPELSAYERLRQWLPTQPRRWLVTGAAGFIGSHLTETLLGLGQEVVGLDNFATGRRENVADVLAAVGPVRAARFRLIEGDIRDPATCATAMEGAACVLHQAALGSVPRSLKDPRTSHDVNVTGFMNVLLAARDAGVKRVVYASSSSVYGDHPALPKREETIGRPLSPYAVTKLADELYAEVFGKAYGLELVGLRYFNVFGPRQDPSGPYAAVIPLWFSALLRGSDVVINGDGETSRDFCYVANVVQANLLAANASTAAALGHVYNVACGDRTTLNQLYEQIRGEVARHRPDVSSVGPRYAPFRAGDVRHSLADIGSATALLGFKPTHRVGEGLAEAAHWYSTEGLVDRR